MKVVVAESAGFCFGVRRAMKIALDAAEATQQVEMLGDIVHNEDVVSLIKKAGIRKIDRLVSGQNKSLLIRAHGEGRAVIKQAEDLGYSIIDATCPMVKEIHRIAEEYDALGYTIIIIGDREHDEVQGIVGQIRSDAVVIDNEQGVVSSVLNGIDRGAVVVQSTQTIENVEAILSHLRRHIKELKFFNTICQPTRKKQKEIKILPVENDVVFIIGSKTSANTKRLYEISKSINSRSYWIHSYMDIRRQWLEGVNSVGITAGASTPEEAINRVVEYLESI